MGYKYVAPSDSPPDVLATIDEMNSLLDAAKDSGTAEAAMLRRRADALGRRLRERMAAQRAREPA